MDKSQPTMGWKFEIMNLNSAAFNLFVWGILSQPWTTEGQF